MISAAGKYYHNEHFKCADCGNSFADGVFALWEDGTPLCQNDFAIRAAKASAT